MSYISFLRDIFILSVSCFGGPHAHLVHYQKMLVNKRKLLSEKALLELYALCQMIPGPTSTQTLISVGYRLGGTRLAYLTLIVWSVPSVLIMMAIGLAVIHLQVRELSLGVTRFVQPMAVGFVSYAAYFVSLKSVYTRTGIGIMIVAGVSAFFVKSPVLFPVILIAAGLITALKYKRHPRKEKKPFNIQWNNFFLWAIVFVIAAGIGGITHWLPIRLFENFYRNGSLILGGGQTLAPLLYTEFVQYTPKQYLTPHEFLLGYAFIHAMPGPLFSFSAYIGALSLRGAGLGSEVLGAVISAVGIFLPGTLLIFFITPIWDSLKRYRPIRASLEGINAANAGLISTTAIALFQPLDGNLYNFGIVTLTFCLLLFSRIPHWVIIGTGLALGFILP